MKNLILIIAAALVISSCEREDPKPITNTVTVEKSCKIQSLKGYDASGSLTGETKYYYSNDRLDSSIGFNAGGTKLYPVMRYEYINTTERKLRGYDASGNPSGGYVMQTIDKYGNILQAKTYDQSGVLLSRSETVFSCN